MLNVLMDYLLLKLTALMLRQAPSKWRMLFGTLVASIIIFILFTPLSPIFNFFLGKIVYSMLIILIVFRYQSFGRFLSALSLFYLSAFMVGGGLFAFHYFIQNQFSQTLAFISNVSYGDPFSWALILVGFPALWLFSKYQVNGWVVRKWKYSEQLSVLVKAGTESVKWTGKVDSGNACKDPMTKGPVLFVQKSSLPPSFSFLAKIEPAKSMDLLDPKDWPEDLRDKVTVIPFRTISQDLLFAPAIKAEQMIINREKEVLAYSHFFIMASQALFSADGEIQCLLHPDMVLKAMNVGVVS